MKERLQIKSSEQYQVNTVISTCLKSFELAITSSLLRHER